MITKPYFDSNVFIELMEGAEFLSFPLRSLMVRLRRRGIPVVSSELVLAEVLVPARARGGPSLHRSYLDLLVFSGAVELHPISRTLLYSVANYRAITGAKVPDAIHVVTAVQCGCPVILTRDDRMKLPDGLTRIRSDDPDIATILDAYLQ
ncbi:type II toxin-antitoxin system VapC family toxin [uncultured Alsobacter sp.]|uniref:type II toxin-antitoxin system VapC family toxin n=1 Tax=uncultured Alsobacter sp. TaxID=1748258 RepID=UPI0025CE49F7|nr:type II toxin-antitoxin system VapC family toxin [uncultured Alsobacter sp.]